MLIPWSKPALKICRLLRHCNLNKRATYQFIIENFGPKFEKSRAIINKRNHFLITSTGRTGTKWLAKLLNKARGAHVVHEPVPDEKFELFQGMIYPEKRIHYLREFRLKEMALRIQEQDPVIYGEVNSVLRLHVEPLQRLLPEIRTIHLVRDGRSVVRSVLNRGLKFTAEPQYHQIRPPVVDEHSAGWDELTWFEKRCWGWQYENQYLRRHIAQRARFEDITSSYRLFCLQILEPLGIKLDETVWEAAVRCPENVTENDMVGTWDDWPRDQQHQFLRICGTEMKEYGYEIPEI